MIQEGDPAHLHDRYNGFRLNGWFISFYYYFDILIKKKMDLKSLMVIYCTNI